MQQSSFSTHDRGLRLIILYKAAKGALQLIGGIILMFGVGFQLTDNLGEVLLELEQYTTQAWSKAAAHALVGMATTRALGLASVVLILDGAMTAFEGWCLHRRLWWAPWLVVAACSVFVPFELEEWVLTREWNRAAILVVNLSIVAYLAHRAVLERRARRAAGQLAGLLTHG